MNTKVILILLFINSIFTEYSSSIPKSKWVSKEEHDSIVNWLNTIPEPQKIDPKQEKEVKENMKFDARNPEGIIKPESISSEDPSQYDHNPTPPPSTRSELHLNRWQRLSKVQKAGIIGGGIAAVAGIMGGAYYLATRNKQGNNVNNAPNSVSSPASQKITSKGQQ